MGGNRILRVIAVLVSSLMMFASCGSGADDQAASDARAAAVYASILDWALDQEPSVVAGEMPEWFLFVASRGEGQVDLDVQAAVVGALESRALVRFIDERVEAVELDIEDEPVRDGGLLIGLGAVAEEGETVDVYVDRYRHAGDVGAWLVTLRRDGTAWVVVDPPNPTDLRPIPTED